MRKPESDANSPALPVIGRAPASAASLLLAPLADGSTLAPMPDWFYRTLAQPVLFRLPDPAARALALRVIGSLGNFRGGHALIDFLGHMQPDPLLAVRVAGVNFTTPIGLGWRVDPERRATRAFARFGFGCIEVHEDAARTVLRSHREQLRERRSRPSARPTFPCSTVPVLQRREEADGTEQLLFPSGIVLPVVAWGEPPASTRHDFLPGVLLQTGTRDASGLWEVPATMPPHLPAQVTAWRRQLGPSAAIVIAGGIAQPSDAQTLIAAGANLLLLDAGVIFRGPGLPKRCNEALVSRLANPQQFSAETISARHAWFWAFAMGAALAVGGALTLGLSLTTVLLPYDEHYLGLSSDLLRRNEPLLFSFMAHDRATLAGTMLGLGWFYAMLAWHAVRRRVHGAKTAAVASALVGFASFFSFLGFGYFDPLHAFVAAVLFQILIQTIVGHPGGAPSLHLAVDDEDAIWRRAQWAQLLWLVHAAGLVMAGAVILAIGMTSVFVAEDLAYLCLTPTQAAAMNERLISVVAHDRATLGGMLLAAGIGSALPLLWCHRRGARWLWWAMAGLGAFAYGATLGVHAKVGYTDWRHIIPALAGLALWSSGLALNRRYLCAPHDRYRPPPTTRTE